MDGACNDSGSAGEKRAIRLGSCRFYTVRRLVTALVTTSAAIALTLAPPGEPAPVAAAATATNPIGLYAGADNVSEVDHVNTALGGTIHYVMDFLDETSWSKMDSPTWWFDAWNPTG